MYNCPNCGAAITGSKCEYCGTRFDIEIKRVYKEPEPTVIMHHGDVVNMGSMSTIEMMNCIRQLSSTAYRWGE